MDLVRSLADAGVPLAVVTSGQRPYAEGLLAELGIRDLLDIVVTAGDVVTGKPHPEGYLAAARDLDVPPQETIGFEDAPAGVAAVKAAGMTCVGVITTQPGGRAGRRRPRGRRFQGSGRRAGPRAAGAPPVAGL
ncbi:HAD-IA family hydrolase [Actinomadura madurae]|nr:HAD-IA family hydrolase [Actinomadura madurae]MCQ0008726.1 HAD-IA family hydrolase [Actinomadura madurae]